MRDRGVLIALVTLSGLALTAWCAPEPRSTAPSPPTTQAFAPVGDPSRLPNAHQITSKVIGGAQPEGDAAFAALREMGVRTIVSVDGAKPDVATAAKYGLRYVHLPITYAGVTEEEGRSIAKALAELPGPIYVHCHHGKHRCAAAVAVACVENGTLPPERAEAVLKTFGTGENYKGLWQAARDARPLTPAELARVHVEYLAARDIPPLADTMVRVDERSDALKEAQKAGWAKADPAHEALLLEELLREAGRIDPSHADVAGFHQKLADAESKVKALRSLLESRPVDASAANAAMKAVGASCTACHAKFRD